MQEFDDCTEEGAKLFMNVNEGLFRLLGRIGSVKGYVKELNFLAEFLYHGYYPECCTASC